MNEVRAQVIDFQTGKVTHEIREGEVFKIIKKAGKYKKPDAGQVKINDNEPFIKVYTKPLFELSKSLNGTESQFLNYLIQYIRYSTGTIAYDNGRPVTRNAMHKETGLGLRSIDRTINSLVDKEILGKHKTGRCITLTVNPFIFMKGYRINKTLYELFCNSKWAKLYEKES